MRVTKTSFTAIMLADSRRNDFPRNWKTLISKLNHWNSLPSIFIFYGLPMIKVTHPPALIRLNAELRSDHTNDNSKSYSSRLNSSRGYTKKALNCKTPKKCDVKIWQSTNWIRFCGTSQKICIFIHESAGFSPVVPCSWNWKQGLLKLEICSLIRLLKHFNRSKTDVVKVENSVPVEDSLRIFKNFVTSCQYQNAFQFSVFVNRIIKFLEIFKQVSKSLKISPTIVTSSSFHLMLEMYLNLV